MLSTYVLFHDTSLGSAVKFKTCVLAARQVGRDWRWYECQMSHFDSWCVHCLFFCTSGTPTSNR